MDGGRLRSRRVSEAPLVLGQVWYLVTTCNDARQARDETEVMAR